VVSFMPAVLAKTVSWPKFFVSIPTFFVVQKFQDMQRATLSTGFSVLLVGDICDECADHQVTATA
jgi:hypothetical protein